MCPIFQVSNVTGENLILLRMFLNLLSTRMPCDYSAPAEFQIDETFAVPVCTSHCCEFYVGFMLLSISIVGNLYDSVLQCKVLLAILQYIFSKSLHLCA